LTLHIKPEPSAAPVNAQVSRRPNPPLPNP